MTPAPPQLTELLIYRWKTPTSDTCSTNVEVEDGDRIAVTVHHMELAAEEGVMGSLHSLHTAWIWVLHKHSCKQPQRPGVACTPNNQLIYLILLNEILNQWRRQKERSNTAFFIFTPPWTSVMSEYLYIYIYMLTIDVLGRCRNRNSNHEEDQGITCKTVHEDCLFYQINEVFCLFLFWDCFVVVVFHIA